MLNYVLKKTNKRNNFDYESYFRFSKGPLDKHFTYGVPSVEEKEDEIEALHDENLRKLRRLHDLKVFFN